MFRTKKSADSILQVRETGLTMAIRIIYSVINLKQSRNEKVFNVVLKGRNGFLQWRIWKSSKGKMILVGEQKIVYIYITRVT